MISVISISDDRKITQCTVISVHFGYVSKFCFLILIKEVNDNKIYFSKALNIYIKQVYAQIHKKHIWGLFHEAHTKKLQYLIAHFPTKLLCFGI